jgi:sigma-B regulation protein RsbU (phosphoserine phosphatase)
MDNPDSSKKLLELNSLIEFSQLINSNLELEFILGNILLSIMGRMLITKGMVLIKTNSDRTKDCYKISSAKGIPATEINKNIDCNFPGEPVFKIEDINEPHPVLKENKFSIFFKIYFNKKLLGILCLGKKPGSRYLEKNEIIFIETLLNISSTTIENSLKFTEIKNLNKQLNEKITKLNSLFELGKVFNSNFQSIEETIKLLRYTLLGNYGIKDLIIFSKYRADAFYILSKNTSIEIPQEYLICLNELKTRILLEPEHKNNFLKFLFKKDFQLVIPVTSQRNEITSIACLGKKLNNTDYSDADIEFLESIINLSVLSVENSILLKESIEKQALENELNIAREIQLELLPNSIPEIKGYQVSAVNKPAMHVGGDYFDVLKLTDSQFALVIADVTGKGTPASLLMANVQSAVHSFLKFFEDEHFNLIDVTQKINEVIYSNTSSEKFITFFWGILDIIDGSFNYVNAGHNQPLLFRNNEIIYLEEGGLMIGIMESGFSYQSGKINFISGDVLVMYTDGVIEQNDSDQLEFGEERLISTVTNSINESTNFLLNSILNSVENFGYGMKQFDDQTLIILKKY